MANALTRARQSHLLRYAGMAAIVGASAWIAKFLVIWAGNSNENLHGTLHVAGTFALVLALALAAWRAAAPRGVGLQVLAVLVAWFLLFVVVGAVEEGLNAALDPADESALAELVLLVIGIPALVLGAAAITRARREA